VKYDKTTGKGTVIAPADSGFGDIVIDPADDNRMILVTTVMWRQQSNGGFGDIFYTTTDGGKTWRNVLPDMTMDNNGMSWIDGYAIHWCSSLALSITDPDKILVNSGNGIWACDNIFGDKPRFYFDSYGIEELVVMDIISIKDEPLYLSAMDYDSFVSEDITVPAKRLPSPFGSSPAMTVAAKNPDIMAVVGASAESQQLRYSVDGGKTFTAIKNSPEPGKVLHSGHIAFNADGSRLLWSPSNTYTAYYTEDFGETWIKVEELAGSGIYIIGDPDDPNYVYASTTSYVAVSSDGGKTFVRNAMMVPSFSRLAVMPGSNGDFLVPKGAGLYIAKNHGESYELVPNTIFCQAVGIGKPKNDGDPYVIYMYGKVKGGSMDENNVWMSEDEGATWERVNDDAHLFGGTGNGNFISGDMNVYGRWYMSTVGLGVVYGDKAEK
jgi:hypothetical protein